MNAAGRRQAQARKHYKHIAPLMRPHYSRISMEKSKNKLNRLIMRERERIGRGKR